MKKNRVKRMKIYVFEWSVGKDWVAAKSKEEAISWYKKWCGCDLDGALVEEVPEIEWDKLFILDLYNCEPEEEHNEDGYLNGHLKQQSFRDFIKDCKIGLITTTYF